MIIDVNSPLQGESINRAEPWTTYNTQYLSRVFGVVENFKNFPNTLGFFAANEVMNDLKTAESNPMYIRVSTLFNRLWTILATVSCHIFAQKLMISRLFSGTSKTTSRSIRLARYLSDIRLPTFEKFYKIPGRICSATTTMPLRRISSASTRTVGVVETLPSNLLATLT
jgi:hypothetical protein